MDQTVNWKWGARRKCGCGDQFCFCNESLSTRDGGLKLLNLISKPQCIEIYVHSSLLSSFKRSTSELGTVIVVAVAAAS